MSYPKVTLNNGLRIANFSSPHAFTFDTGEVLEGCSPEHCKALSMERKTSEVTISIDNGSWIDCSVSFELTDAIDDEILSIEIDDEIDIVLVPFPMLNAMKEANCDLSKFRVCLLADRIKKTIHSNKFSC